MKELFWNASDLAQIKARALTLEEIMAQIELFRRGFPFVRLLRPCTVGDGVRLLGKSEIRELGEIYQKTSLSESHEIRPCFRGRHANV